MNQQLSIKIAMGETESNSRHMSEVDEVLPDVQFTRIVEQNQKFIKRIITIAYRIYPERTSKNIEYAASMFRNDKAMECEKNGKPIVNESFCRKRHIQTALGRLTVRPLYATLQLADHFRQHLQQSIIRKMKQEEQISKLTVEQYNNWKNMHKENKLQKANSEETKQWKEIRRELDELVRNFLRRQVVLHGVGAKMRLRISEIERMRGITKRRNSGVSNQKIHNANCSLENIMGSMSLAAV